MQCQYSLYRFATPAVYNPTSSQYYGLNNNMELNLTTPALLFPAISLLLLAYTKRFLTLANLIRSLHSQYAKNQDQLLRSQIDSLRQRVTLIRQMQFTGILSLLFCVVCMFTLYAGYTIAGHIIFAISLLIMMLSLVLTLMEIHLSVNALNLELSDLEDKQ